MFLFFLISVKGVHLLYLFIGVIMGCSDSTAAQPNQNQQQTQPQTQPSAQKPATTTTNTANTSTNKPVVATTTTTTASSNSKHDLELARHNEYRKKHQASPLVLSEWLNKGAQEWADHLAKNNKFQHSQCNISGKDVGENIYWSSAAPKGGDATKAWYDEVKDYVYGSGEKTFSKTGHFSQVVWKESKEVGFGFAGGVVVGNYYPGGNLMGSWEKNVAKPA